METARALQQELLSDCEPVLWGQGVFEPGGYTLDSLIREARRCDFAVLIATGDDIRESRGEQGFVPRDNVILEFGLFAGVLGRERTYVLATPGVGLPTDILGLTRLAYHDKSNLHVAVTQAAAQVRRQIRDLGKHSGYARPTQASSETAVLDDELTELAKDARAQGWTVKNTRTALRLKSPKGRTHTLSKSTAERTRAALRPFVARLRAGGLRVSGPLRRAPEESLFLEK